MSRRSSSSTRAGSLQCGKVVRGEEVQVLDQRRHGRVEAVALLQLQGQAFAKVAGKHATGSKPCIDPKVSSMRSSGAPSSSPSEARSPWR